MSAGEIATIVNESGEEIPGFACIAITGMTTRENRRVYRGNKPTATLRWRYAINGPTPIPTGKWGDVFIDGCCLAVVDVTSPSATAWGPKADEWKLFPRRPGFESWEAAGEGDALRYVQFVPMEFRAKLDGMDLAFRDEADAIVITLTEAGGADEDTELELSVKDVLLETGFILEDEAIVMVKRQAGNWVAHASANCRVPA